MVGQVIAHYRILSRLGAGGMGEVYLAEDTRLGRKVALKVLPAEVTKDEDRLRRFEQEARAASALNHPNILVIHEIGREGDTHFIATEFIEGETLRQHFLRMRMELREVLDVGIQAASALAAAHAAGIVHRDIKPENIMLRPDGYVKVLDFGLAKLAERQAVALVTGAETAAKVEVKTEPGKVMGTVNYMSPEQARGLAVDARTDNFSLGVVLYEMIAGCPPFEGATTSDVIVSILQKEPPPLARYSREVPEALEWIATKALRKDRDERYQTVKELLTDLKRLKQRLEVEAELQRSMQPELAREGTGLKPAHPISGQAMGEAPSQPSALREIAGTARPTSSAEIIIGEIKRHKAGAVIGLAVFVIAIAGIVFGLYKLVSQKQSMPAAPFQTMRIARLTTTGKAANAAISPDGKYVAHVMAEAGQQSLWLKQVATDSNVPILPPAEVQYPGLTFSHDGNYVYYVRSEKGSTFRVLFGQRPH